jgi:hypothetical protein
MNGVGSEEFETFEELSVPPMPNLTSEGRKIAESVAPVGQQPESGSAKSSSTLPPIQPPSILPEQEITDPLNKYPSELVPINQSIEGSINKSVPSSGPTSGKTETDEDNKVEESSADFHGKMPAEMHAGVPDSDQVECGALEGGEPGSELDAPPSSEMTLLLREQLKYCSSIMRSLKRHKDAGPFLNAVDAVALNVPDYYDIIKRPMDFGTISTNISKGKYASVESFVLDVRQVFLNCATYNKDGTVVNAMGKRLEAAFDNLLKKMPTAASLVGPSVAGSGSGTPARPNNAAEMVAERARRSSAVMKRRYDSPEFESTTPLKRASMADLQSPSTNKAPASRRGSLKGSSAGHMSAASLIQEDLRFMGQVIRDFFKKQYHGIAWPFLQPVDPVALGIPDYPTVVSRPMDLGTIKQRVDHRAYTHAEDLKDDFLLMCNNCYAYNGPDAEVSRYARQLEAIFMRQFNQRPSVHQSEDGGGILSFGGGSAEEELAHVDQQIRDRQRQLQLLESELVALRRRKLALQQQKRAAPAPRKPSSTGSSSFSGGVSSRKSKAAAMLTFEDKRQLSFDINELAPERLGRVLDIINESMPHLRAANADSDEIELDIDSLDAATLYRLQKYVKQCKADTANNSLGHSLQAPPYPMDLSSEEEDLDE